MILGNDYRVQSSYYGGYPAGYLRRVRALYPDAPRTLHLFSGMVDTTIFPGDTLDCNAALHPTYTSIDAAPLRDYALILADPPYSAEYATHYGTPMIDRNAVFRALQACTPGTHIVWLDQVLPMFRKDYFELIGVVGVVRSTNHRFRVMAIFLRRDAPPSANVRRRTLLAAA
jgi:hypothetical protein